MSFVGDLLGAGSGSDWKPEQQAYNNNIINPVTSAQTDTSYNQSQTGLQQQQDFLTALQAQNGISNQNASYNAYQGLANGTGPNPAQAALAQATGANVANQAALMAGQRGAGANIGLIGRQAAMQGGNIQQQAAGQSATMQAQQQLAGIQGMAGIAGQQVGNQAAATTGYSQAAQSEQQNLLNAVAQRNNAQANLSGSQNSANSQIQVQNSKAQQGLFGGALGGAGSILAHGGMVEAPKKYADGGDVISNQPMAPVSSGGSAVGPKSGVGKFLWGSSPESAQQSGGGGALSNMGQLGGDSGPGQINSGSGQIVSKLVNYAKPTIQDLFHPTDPKGMGSQFNGGEAPNLGVNTSIPGASPASPVPNAVGNMPASQGPSLGADTNFEPANVSDMLDANAATPTAAEGADASEAAAAGEGAGAAEAAGEGATAAEGAETASAIGEGSSLGDLAALLAKGGKVQGKGKKVDAVVSPGERYLSPNKVKEVAEGKANPMKAGEKIKGQAKVAGDSYANDTVPKKLEEGGIVLPRSVTQSADPAHEAYKFVQAVLAKKGLKRSLA